MAYQNNYHSSKHNKKRLTQDQVRLLEASFGSNKKLDPELKLQLSRELGIPPRRIAIWYQNKRARWKNEILELDYNALQMRLDMAITQKSQLEREVGRLQAELQKVQQPQARAGASMCDTNCSFNEGGGISSVHEDHMKRYWLDNVNDEVLQVEQLYAYMMGTNGTN
ncbi:hypothetical protein LguiA_023081 [Lonicera macranthoides]